MLLSEGRLLILEATATLHMLHFPSISSPLNLHYLFVIIIIIILLLLFPLQISEIQHHDHGRGIC